MTPAQSQRLNITLLAVAGIGLVAGLLVQVFGPPGGAAMVWALGVLPVLVALLFEIARSLRRGEVGLDIVAALSMMAALAVGEALAAAVVALMYSGGTFLESYAHGRARREMRALMARVPRTAMRLRGDALEEIPLAELQPGDRLLIRRGDIVPVDGTVTQAVAFLDTSAVTGESMPVRLSQGAEVLSGATNAGEAFTMQATHPAAESTYAGILRLVEQAQRSKAPMSRLADRWSLGFLALTVVIALAAWWVSGDPIRAVAVLVVATPCPLILAVPVALVAGVSRAARFGVLVKGASPLETMARVRAVVLDKTGTLTDGRPRIAAIHARPGWQEAELLRLVAALDQASSHPVAKALVAEARALGAQLPVPLRVSETAGEGVEGEVDGKRICAGSLDFVLARTGAAAALPMPGAAGEANVWAGVDGVLAGHIVLSDPPRAGAHALMAALRQAGIGQIIVASGDRAEVVARIGAGMGFDAVHGALTPTGKVSVVRDARIFGPVMMVGDGINDAPALAAADVGVAMGARGAAASAEAADVVLLVDDVGRIAPGIEIAQRARRIALESVVVGIGLSVLGMMAAALGYLTPVQGALLQEGIDVAVIFNALRALRITPAGMSQPTGPRASAPTPPHPAWPR